MPAQRPVQAGELLELGTDLGQRHGPLLPGQAPAGEETAGTGNAAGLQAFAFHRLEATADDEFGRAAADVDHQALLAGLGRLCMGNAQVDQACFLAP